MLPNFSPVSQRQKSSRTSAVEYEFNKHRKKISFFAVLNGDRFASGSDDGTVIIWNANKKREEVTLSGFAGKTTALTELSRERIAISSENGTIYVWNFNKKKYTCEKIFQINGYGINVLTVMHNYLISCSTDCTIRLWNMNDEKWLNKVKTHGVLRGHRGSVNALTIFQNDKLISGSQDGELKLWDIIKKQCLQTFQYNEPVINILCLDNDYLAIQSSNKNIVLQFHVENNHLQNVFSLNATGSLINLGNNRLACVADRKKIQIWNYEHHIYEETLLTYADAITALVLCGEFLVSGAENGNIRWWNIKLRLLSECLVKRSLVARGLKRHYSVLALAVLKANVLAVAQEKKIILWDMTEEQQVGTLVGHTDWIFRLVVMPTNYLVSQADDQSIRVWDSVRRVCVYTRMDINNVFALTTFGNDRLAFISDDDGVCFWNVGNNQVDRYQFASAKVSVLAAFKNNSLAIGFNNGKIQILSKQEEQWITPITLSGHTRKISCLASFSQSLASGSSDNTIRIWSKGPNGRWCCEIVLEGHTNEIISLVALSGNILVSASADQTIRVWRKFYHNPGNLLIYFWQNQMPCWWECQAILSAWPHKINTLTALNHYLICGFDNADENNLQLWNLYFAIDSNDGLHGIKEETDSALKTTLQTFFSPQDSTEQYSIEALNDVCRELFPGSSITSPVKSKTEVSIKSQSANILTSPSNLFTKFNKLSTNTKKDLTYHKLWCGIGLFSVAVIAAGVGYWSGVLEPQNKPLRK